jgi:hypothetical protein
VTTLTLGGPGVACSVTRLRRLAAGELLADERARVAEHLDACARCQSTAAELEAERRALTAELPFDAFAAGVAERLARSQARPARPAWRRALPLALAAGLAAVVAVPLLSRLAPDRPLVGVEDGIRLKGGAAVTLLVRDGAAARALAPGEPLPSGAALRLSLAPAGRRFAAAALVDEDGPALIFAGPAAAGPLPGAFEWTGRRGQVVVVLGDEPVDGPALLARLGSGDLAAAPPGPAAEVLVVPLVRSAR